jgi:hypothetical protein
MQSDSYNPDRVLLDFLANNVKEVWGDDLILVTKAVVIYEVVNSEGARELLEFHTDEVSVWEKLGMIEFVKMGVEEDIRSNIQFKEEGE